MVHVVLSVHLGRTLRLVTELRQESNRLLIKYHNASACQEFRDLLALLGSLSVSIHKIDSYQRLLLPYTAPLGWVVVSPRRPLPWLRSAAHGCQMRLSAGHSNRRWNIVSLGYTPSN